MSISTSSMAIDPLQPHHGWFARLLFAFLLWSLKGLSAFAYSSLRFCRPRPIHHQPSLLVQYTSLPNLTHRVFFPRPQSSGSGDTLNFPLYISAHSGANALMTPEFDDGFAAEFASKHCVVVVNVDFKLAPHCRFPAQIHDLVAVTQELLDDKRLPVDRQRVVLAGFSAGGALALAAAQMPELQGKIQGVVAWYPALDYSLSTAARLASRPKDGPVATDSMAAWTRIFSWGCVPAGQRLRDPLLSPRYAERTRLPRWICLVGAEWDMYCHEARETAFALAGTTSRDQGEWNAFEDGGIKWMAMKGMRHGFTHDLMDGKGRQYEKARLERTEEAIRSVGQWLMAGPFKT